MNAANQGGNVASMFWANYSQVMVKWLTIDKSGTVSGNALDPGRTHTQSDSGIVYAGWSFGAPGCPPYQLTIMEPVSGYSLINYVAQTLPSSAELTEFVESLPTPEDAS